MCDECFLWVSLGLSIYILAFSFSIHSFSFQRLSASLATWMSVCLSASLSGHWGVYKCVCYIQMLWMLFHLISSAMLLSLLLGFPTVT